MSSFSELLAAFEKNAYSRLTISPDWAQGRATFGGLVAALLYKAARHQVDADRKIRNAQITFVGPVAADVEVVFETLILREGGSATTLECKAIQEGKVQATLIASFGKSRESSLSLPPLIAPPDYPQADSLPTLPFKSGMTPEFIQHFDMAWAEGSYPFSGDKSRTMGGWCRFAEHTGSADETELLTLIDTWPPIAIQMLDAFAPVSTLNWSVQFIQDLPELSASDWYKYRVSAEQGADGYSNTQAHIWSERGELLAISSQTVAVFA